MQALIAKEHQDVKQKGLTNPLSNRNIRAHVREMSVSFVRSETVRKELESTLIAARTVSREELPRLLGDLEEIRATALARLAAPAQGSHLPDSLLGVEEAATAWGSRCITCTEIILACPSPRVWDGRSGFLPMASSNFLDVKPP